ncbi:transglycosylase family protein [Glutamicibacter creatinolyticus]|uniref:Resuscitation-promoting factor Rpf n=1 Tax=Glutamicibacter creatinolyticus TaxID=162496 RepID=A0A5B7WSW5_9MICC|nr:MULTISPECIES: transglycosylase family protein [Glutamicibacter]QCY46280.1 Resuscitation-promoting factor Rpf precursor [Glutamicibacter creatinolyticus]TLK56751.1 LysM peptidoglycan-binding domain-containing protein [Glutamicibacter sp. V16R2B1]
MIQQKSKKTIRRGTAALAAVAVAGGAMAVAAVPASAASTWDALAQCESSGNWSTNTGNGYYGGLQFSDSTWKAYGGKGSAANASKAEQIRVATKVQQGQGWGAWPACSAKLGLSGKPTGTPKAQTKKAAPQQSTQKTTAKKYTTQKAAPKKQTTLKSVERTAVKTQSGKHVAPVAKAPVYNVKATDSGKNYTVKAGDTLFKIAQDLGLDDWRSLFSVNSDKLSNPDLIFVGQTLNVPTK